MIMKEIPTYERPYERCIQDGATALSDIELMAVILRNGTKDINSLDLAKNLLTLTDNQGVVGLTQLCYSELISIKGIGQVKAIQILCVIELAKRISLNEFSKGHIFRSPYDIAKYYIDKLRFNEVEEVWLMMLNTKKALIHETLVSRGTINACIISPREILIESLRQKAVHIVIVHNHPSGDASPSKEDIMVTRQLNEASKVVGVSLLDHIIIGDKSFVSLKERGYLP